MTKEIKSMKLVENRRGQVLTTSRIIAEIFNKEHKHVIRDIETIIGQMAALSQSPNLGSAQMFIKTSYQAEKGGRRYPMYLLNRDGFSLLVMGFTGEKAMGFKLKFIAEFNRMEQALKSEWQRLRRTGIDKGRKPLTDAIQQFNLRDFADGDKNPLARQRYGALTAKSQTKIFGIPSGGRDTATGRELAMLYLGEETMKNALNKAYALGVDYKQAEQIALHSAKQILLLLTGEISSLAS